MAKIDDNGKLSALTQILQAAFSMIIATAAGLGFIISSLKLNDIIYNSVTIVLVITFILCVIWAINVYLKINKYLKT